MDYLKPARKGKGLRTAVTAAIVVSASCCLGLIVVPVFQSARIQARRAAVTMRVKALDRAVLMYADEHDERLPPLSSTSSTVPLEPYLSQASQGEDTKLAKQLILQATWNERLSYADLASLSDTSTAWLFYCPRTDDDMEISVVAYANGNIGNADRMALQRMIKTAFRQPTVDGAASKSQGTK